MSHLILLRTEFLTPSSKLDEIVSALESRFASRFGRIGMSSGPVSISESTRSLFVESKSRVGIDSIISDVISSFDITGEAFSVVSVAGKNHSFIQGQSTYIVDILKKAGLSACL